MRVAEVMAPASWSSAMARLTPGVRPKSSALMMRREDIGMRREQEGRGREDGALARVYRMQRDALG